MPRFWQSSLVFCLHCSALSYRLHDFFKNILVLRYHQTHVTQVIFQEMKCVLLLLQHLPQVVVVRWT